LLDLTELYAVGNNLLGELNSTNKGAELISEESRMLMHK